MPLDPLIEYILNSNDPWMVDFRSKFASWEPDVSTWIHLVIVVLSALAVVVLRLQLLIQGGPERMSQLGMSNPPKSGGHEKPDVTSAGGPD